MDIIKRLITPNKYSRPKKLRKSTKAIIVHWIANPMTTAMMNRNYFDSLKNGTGVYASAHEIIGLEGEVVICLPKNEMAYHVGSKTYTQKALDLLGSYPNNSTYGIECCHLDWKGTMTNETYSSLVERCATLCEEFNLNALTDIWTHKQVVGWKDCHRWFVDNHEAWKLFLIRVNKRMEERRMKTYKELIIERTDSPDRWINLIENAKQGILEIEDLELLEWLKEFTEKIGNP